MRAPCVGWSLLGVAGRGHQVRHGRIVTVTPNPALDVTYTLAGFQPGSSHRVANPTVRAGGKGLNVARVAAAQGYRVLALAPVGGHTGQLYRSDLDEYRLPARLITSPSETRRSTTIVDTSTGEATVLNEHGASSAAHVWEELSAQTTIALRDASVLVGSGSLPPGAPAGFYLELGRLAAQAGVPCILDTSGTALLEAAAAGAALLKPNEEELLAATGARAVPDGARQLLARGAQRVLVSCGGEGMHLYTAAHPNSILQARLPRPLAGNPTGAGDAAVAAVAAFLADGGTEPQSMLRLAVAWSAAAVLTPAAGEISPQYRELMNAVIISEKEN